MVSALKSRISCEKGGFDDISEETDSEWVRSQLELFDAPGRKSEDVGKVIGLSKAS